jgi:FkbM family methyltransferase
MKLINKNNCKLFLFRIFRKIPFLRNKYHDFFSSKRFLEMIFGGQKEFFFIQIGGNDGVSFDWLFDFLENINSSGVIIEPIPEYFEQLKINHKNPKIKLLNLAIHPDKSSEVIFKVKTESQINYEPWVKGIASFQKNHLIKLGININHIVSENVSCTTINELILDQEVISIDYLQIDTEGFDYEVLKTIDFSFVTPTVIRYEHQNLNEQDYFDAQKLLKENGYKLMLYDNDTVAINFN